MNRITVGMLCGIAFGIVDVLMRVLGNHPDRSNGMLLQAFSSRLRLACWQPMCRSGCTQSALHFQHLLEYLVIVLVQLNYAIAPRLWRRAQS